MRRGTTPTHTFVLPIDTSDIAKAQIVYVQGEEEILRKETADCSIDEQSISVTLTQEETFLFDEKKNVRIQIRLLTNAGNALASNIMLVSVQECLDDGVL